MIERVLTPRWDGHELEPKHQVVPRRNVVVVPHVHNVRVFPVQHERRHEAHRPLDRAGVHLALPALVLLAVDDPKRPDQVLHNVHQVGEVVF